MPLPWSYSGCFVPWELWEVGRNPPPGSALNQGIDPQLPGEAKLPPLGTDLLPGGVGQAGGTTKDSCSDRDGRAGRRQKITGVKALSLTTR